MNNQIFISFVTFLFVSSDFMNNDTLLETLSLKEKGGTMKVWLKRL